ncbi:hypothetical protein JR316_0010079 [Psilocybe cubensis]|uniref:Uncharacterized protein n=2 Tax=Psilocybe cubensis TaxID=181762 RepID=A0ACB8GQZ8_PSICU|nr:hypothetical protein JR316_0010079 [Psilocybe cubensis]KAH9477847.1 hypothetical protein JR316_0010079 [Psilocybe cubensis]
MSPDGSLENAIPPQSSNWHSIRPWAPSLSLGVREITSVSATFILSSTLSGELDSSLASIGLEAAEDDANNVYDDNGVSTPTSRRSSSVIADALAKGLSVNVNGSAWQRAFIRIDDQLDEAVIIIYALMPGRQYDIELALASAGQPATIRRQVTTQDDSEPETAGNTTDPESPNPDNSSSSDPHSTPSTSPSRTVPGTPPAAPQITLEDRLNQLQHTLSTVNAEQESLIASLKSARKDAQKADAALRSEIETLKRTSEKNSSAELRGKQKVLALQESVKRANNATKEMEQAVEEIKSGLPELTSVKDQKEAEYAKIKQEADRIKKEREDVEEKERKRIDTMKAELAGLTNKLEKLGGKKDKLESTIIPDLEGKLSEVAGEIEAEELELARLEEEDNQNMINQRFQRSLESDQPIDTGSPSYIPMQRNRYHAPGEQPIPIGRPAPAPIQRPHVEINHSVNGNQSTSNLLWSPPMSLRQAQSLVHPHTPGQMQTHSPRSQSYNAIAGHNPSTIMLSPQRRASLNSKSVLASAPSISTLATSSTSSFSSLPSSTPTTSSSPASSPINSSPTRSSPGMTAATSTLSSRAPAFEPLRPILNGNNQLHGQGHSNSNTTTTNSSGFSSSHSSLSSQRPRGFSNSRPGAPPASSKNGSHSYTLWNGAH